MANVPYVILGVYAAIFVLASVLPGGKSLADPFADATDGNFFQDTLGVIGAIGDLLFRLVTFDTGIDLPTRPELILRFTFGLIGGVGLTLTLIEALGATGTAIAAIVGLVAKLIDLIPGI